MENIEKIILAMLIVIFTIYILLKIVFKLDNKIDSYTILGLYLLVLILGLLRPDQEHYYATGLIELDPFGFISDIKTNESSIFVMLNNLIIFIPMYFLLSYANVFNSFLRRFIVFEAFAFLIEYLQFQLGVGLFDLSDIFLYNVGFFVGVVVALPFLKALKKRSVKKENHTHESIS